MAISPSYFQKSEKSASEVSRIAQDVGRIKSHQEFQAMEVLPGDGKSLKQCQEPGGRSVGFGCFPASRHRVAYEEVVVVCPMA